MISISKYNNTLFLDRDGVINHRPPADYVKSWEDFKFLPGVLSALHILSDSFDKIFIVTNQQGIGKNLMKTQDLDSIHSKMLEEIENHGGRIDRIYFCPDLADKADNCRKPGIKMAEQAQKDFPEIDFSKSIMAGDTESDMLFGKSAGMKTILIQNTNEIINKKLIDFEFNSLIDFANSLHAID